MLARRLTARGSDRTLQARAFLSMDVFDTTLTRSCGPPEALALWLGNRLVRRGIVTHTPERFARVRLRAERDVWRRAGGMDASVSLYDFHEEVVRALWLDEDLLPTLVEEELALEAEVLQVLPVARRMIAEAAGEGGVVFVTDTYFPVEFVEHQLRTRGLWAPGTRCFASGEWARSKASGRLFDTLVEAVGGSAERILHAGDNPHSDVDVPRRKGIRALWFDDGRLNRHERLLAEHMWETGGLSAAFAGASRLARLHTPVGHPRQRAIRDVAAGVAAPFLTGYVLWTLHRACDLGLERLYFLARDGQVLAEIAARLAKRLGLDVSVSYLHVSRLSTNLAATFEVSDEEVGWVLRDREYLSPPEFLERFDLRWEDVAGTMEALGARRNDPSLSPTTGELRTALQSEPLRRAVLARAEERRALVVDYLAQEGLLDGDRCGIVDFGGVGSQIRALHTLTLHAGAPAPRLFLVGVDRPEDAGLPATSATPPWLEDTECYLYDHRRNRGIRRFRGFGTCVQMFCAADHGTVTGYRRSPDGVFPTMTEDVASLVEGWGLPTLRETVRHFVDVVTLDSDLVEPRADARAATCAAIQQFWAEPTGEEADAWGAFPFEGAQAASDPTPLAQAYSWTSVGRGLIDRTYPDLGWQHWHEGSLELTRQPLRRLLTLAETYYWRLEAASHPWARRTTGFVRRWLGR